MSIKDCIRRYRINNPWAAPLFAARSRCNNPNNWSYKYYGGRGIKCLLVIEEIKNLWIRDDASKMKCPTIDRIDNDGDYVFNNCRFIEKSENSRKSNLNNPRWVTNKGCKKKSNGLLGKTKFKDIVCPVCLNIFRPYLWRMVVCSRSCASRYRNIKKLIEAELIESKG